ncbi:MAG: hypothetical protein ACYTGX_07890 [Planctomycetota bacterium]|jgi:hypothetical protein
MSAISRLLLGGVFGCLLAGGSIAAPLQDGKAAKEDEKAEKEIKIAEMDEEFMGRVNAAIGRGVQHLLTKQAPDGHWPSQHEKFQHGPYPHGVTALVLLTLLKSQANRFDERIEKGFAFLKERWDNFHTGGKQWEGAGGWRVYEAGITLMALEALARWKPPSMAGKKHKTRAVGGNLKKPEIEWAKQLAEWLIATQTNTRQIKISTGNGGYRTEFIKECWHYPTSTNGATDHSNTQYAVLGLRSAGNLGIPVPAKTWQAVYEHFIFVQEETGPKVNRVILKRKKKKKKKKSHAGGSEALPFTPHTVSTITDRARGWGYFGNDKPKSGTGEIGCTTGSMTTVGLACVAIAWNELEKAARRDKDARKFVRDRKNRQARDTSINDGFAWMAHHFTVDENPYHPGGGWHYYYLYGMERAGVLTSTVNIGKYDWYREGGEKILGAESNGSWNSGKGDGPIGSTCFALLFLGRATVPLVQTTK